MDFKRWYGYLKVNAQLVLPVLVTVQVMCTCNTWYRVGVLAEELNLSLCC